MPKKKKITFLCLSFAKPIVHLFVKDLNIGAHILQGLNRGSIYKWPQTSDIRGNSPCALIGMKTYLQQWYHHLGYLS